MNLSQRLVRVVLGCALLAGYGCDDGGDGLTVSGSATVDLGDAQTGFNLGAEVSLDDDRAPEVDGALAGHCAITQGENDAGGVLDVAIVRPGVPEEGDRGLRSFTVRIEQSDEGEAAEVTAALGAEQFSASGSATCVVTQSYVYEDIGAAGVEVDCDLASSEGETAHATADLHFSGCDLL